MIFKEGLKSGIRICFRPECNILFNNQNFSTNILHPTGSTRKPRIGYGNGKVVKNALKHIDSNNICKKLRYSCGILFYAELFSFIFLQENRLQPSGNICRKSVQNDEN